jgi:hypothetical protein
MNNSSRLIGIDYLRVLATFAVVILHADEGIEIKSPVWSLLTKLADFAVPFFLLTSFFFTLRSVLQNTQIYNWRLRILRLMIPFFSWCLIYLIWRVVRYILSDRLDQIQDTVKEIPSLLILGQTGFAFHLYFLPLLLMGNLVIILTVWLIRLYQHPVIWLTVTGVSLCIYQSYDVYLSGVKERLSDFGGWQYYLLVLFGYLIRCLPYIAIARLMIYPSVLKYLYRFKLFQIGFLTGCFVLISLINIPVLPPTLIEVLKSTYLLLIALSMSQRLQANDLINSMSLCSYGIYLSHLLFIELIWSIFTRLGFRIDQGIELSFIPLLLVSTFSFLVAWLVTAVLMRQKQAAKLLFGA